jgi:hypothetical protein
MEMDMDNLKMDVSGMELSVAHAHREIQRVEDEVLKPFMDGGYLARQDCRVLDTGSKGEFTQWVHCEFFVSPETIRPVVTQQVRGEFF